MIKILKNNQGFTLVESVASIVLITIALISFYYLYINSHKTATSNYDQLVAINLAEAELERIKLTPFEAEYLPSIDEHSPTYSYILNKEKELYTGGDPYHLEVVATQTSEEKNNKLINVVVTVSYNKKKSTVEGYINYE